MTRLPKKLAYLIWKAIVVFWMFIWLRCGLFYVASRVVRAFTEWPHRKGWPAIKQWTDYPRWKTEADKWSWGHPRYDYRYDLISYPWTIQYIVDTGEDGLGDVDDWSVYIGWCLRAMEKRSPIFGKYYQCKDFRLLTVACLVGWKLVRRTVCIFDMTSCNEPTRYGMCSNYDYAQLISGTPNRVPFMSVAEIIKYLSCGDLVSWSVGSLECRKKREHVAL